MGEHVTTIRICPRCHEALPEAVYWEALPPVAGHLPAYRLRHQRRDGKRCIVYVGPVQDESIPSHAPLMAVGQ